MKDLARLRTFMETRRLPIPEQFGFRAKHSCTHQVHRITEHILAKKLEIALFADVTYIYTSSPMPDAILKRLQTAADALGGWFGKWRIEINPTKSAALFFTRRKPGYFNYPHPPVTLMDSPIPWVDKTKYLGVVLDTKLSFVPHITRIRNRAAFSSKCKVKIVPSK